MTGTARLCFTCPWSITYLFSCHKRAILSLVLTSERSDTWVVPCPADLSCRGEAGCSQCECRKSLQSCIRLAWLSVYLLTNMGGFGHAMVHSWGLSVNEVWQESQTEEEMVAKLKEGCLQPETSCMFLLKTCQWACKMRGSLLVSEMIFERHLMADMDDPSGLQQCSYKSVEMCSAGALRKEWVYL